MRNAAFGMSAALFASIVLSACGGEPEPVGPVEPSFDQTTESTDTDGEDSVLPGTGLPSTELDIPEGAAPGEIPEIMEHHNPAPGDTTSEMLGETQEEAEPPL
ncbi:hypothetical protein K1X12_13910 [Hyphomonas sp. WL0036]|uniref:hypothetical protein n=1 Tax=Hyphomonas sediminis TaxID=2866160 RepID=UPI001C7F0FAA|nr:hypothetical protein [Hyphomonas sediminis]MBY9068002.1 hypothetical protein [Hyphomonas sediminis]